MYKSGRSMPGPSRAEEQVAKHDKQKKKALLEKERDRKEKAAQVARLRALRLAKEAADKLSAEAEAALQPAPKPRRRKAS